LSLYLVRSLFFATKRMKQHKKQSTQASSMNMSPLRTNTSNNLGPETQIPMELSLKNLQEPKEIEEELVDEKPKSPHSRRQIPLAKNQSVQDSSTVKIETLDEDDDKDDFHSVVVAAVSANRTSKISEDNDEEEPSTVISMVSEKPIVKKEAPLPPTVKPENDHESKPIINDDTDDEETKSILSEDVITEFDEIIGNDDPQNFFLPEQKESDEEEASKVIINSVLNPSKKGNLEEEAKKSNVASKVIINSVLNPSKKINLEEENEDYKKEEVVNLRKDREHDGDEKKTTIGTMFIKKVFGKNEKDNTEKSTKIDNSPKLNKSQKEEMNQNDTITLENTFTVSSDDDDII